MPGKKGYRLYYHHLGHDTHVASSKTATSVEKHAEVGNKDDGDMHVPFAGLGIGAASSADTVLKLVFPNKLKTDLDAQCKVTGSVERSLKKAIGDAKRMSASLRVKAGSEPLYQPKMKQLQNCSNLIGERMNLVEDDEDQLKTAMTKPTSACQHADLYLDPWRARLPTHANTIVREAH